MRLSFTDLAKETDTICRLLFEIIDGEFPSLDRSMAYLSLEINICLYKFLEGRQKER